MLLERVISVQRRSDKKRRVRNRPAGWFVVRIVLRLDLRVKSSTLTKAREGRTVSIYVLSNEQRVVPANTESGLKRSVKCLKRHRQRSEWVGRKGREEATGSKVRRMKRNCDADGRVGWNKSDRPKGGLCLEGGAWAEWPLEIQGQRRHELQWKERPGAGRSRAARGTMHCKLAATSPKSGPPLLEIVSGEVCVHRLLPNRPKKTPQNSC